MSDNQSLPFEDRFAIFEQMNLHQRRIDDSWGREQAQAYVDLYWPGGIFHVHDLRDQTFTGDEGLKQLYDYAHSVFPIEKWSHTMGPFSITGSGNQATADWRWLVMWRHEIQGIVSSGLYHDTWEKRDGIWKVVERTSTIDQNWPAQLFQPYVDREEELFRAS